MRTTVTLDEDVAAALQALATARGWSFKQAINTTLRAGLSPERALKAYRVRPRRLGLRSGVDLDKALRLAGDLEDQELVRKLELRK